MAAAFHQGCRLVLSRCAWITLAVFDDTTWIVVTADHKTTHEPAFHAVKCLHPRGCTHPADTSCRTSVQPAKEQTTFNSIMIPRWRICGKLFLRCVVPSFLMLR